MLKNEGLFYFFLGGDKIYDIRKSFSPDPLGQVQPNVEQSIFGEGESI